MPPGQQEPQAIALPALGELDDDDVYVPAGWCWTGGDDAASDGLPARRLWIDGFVMKRHPVTNGEYLAFLNDLVERAPLMDSPPWLGPNPALFPDTQYALEDPNGLLAVGTLAFALGQRHRSQ